MTNRIQLFSALAALLCIISCNEKITQDLPTVDYIIVTSEVASQTKAGYEGTSSLPDAFQLDINQDGNDKDYSKLMKRDGAGNKYSPSDNTEMTWKSADHSGVQIKAITTPDGYNINKGDMSVKTDQRESSAVEASDLLGAATGYGIEINKNNLIVHFNHLMSKMYITYNKSESVKVSSVELRNICLSGEFSYQNLAYGNVSMPNENSAIKMYHNSDNNTAEAIFFPYKPGNEPVLVVNLEGQDTPVTCPISLKNVTEFQGGKRYIMNIVITGSSIEGAEVTVKDWSIDNSSIQILGERVLWVGTSIPAGSPETGIISYPYLVDDAMNCTVINKAVAGSLVIRNAGGAESIRTNTVKADWDNFQSATNAGEYATYHLMWGGLAQSHAEIEALSSALEDVWGNPTNSNQQNERTQWVNKHIEKLKSLSYESRIIPYIDGTLDNCTTVIIDHGFNDRAAMVYEANGYKEGGEEVTGYNQLMRLIKSVYSYEEYVAILDQWPNLTLNGNYIVEMTRVINAIKNVNPDIRIIIGNHFVQNSPFVAKEYRWVLTHPDLMDTTYEKYGSLICYFNEAVAALNGLDVVNVYKYLRVDEERYWSYDY